MRRVMWRCILSVLAAGLLAPIQAGAENWPQWRGPEGQGVSSETDVPLEWSATEHVAWKIAIPGRGHSSPIVWGPRVFVTTAIEGPVVPGAAPPRHTMGGREFKHPDSLGGDRRYTFKVMALDLDTGRVLWDRTVYEGTVYDDRHRKSSYASPTPVTDGRHVWAYFGAEGLYCFDVDGRPVWKASVGPIKTMGLGVGASPVLFENLIILQCDEDEGEESFIVALDKRTGKEAWRAARPVEVSWSTPVLVRAAGRIELVTSGSDHIIAYDPATGRELWRSEGVKSNAIHTPLVGHDLVIVTTGYPAKRTIALRPGESPAGGTRVAWQYDKGTAYVVSPILYGDFLYLVTDKGIVTCLDPKSGEVKYEGGRVPVPASFMASPVAADGTVLLTSEDGDTFVVKAGPRHEVLRTNALGEPVYSSPAISQGRILIRGLEHLYCIRRAAPRVEGGP